MTPAPQRIRDRIEDVTTGDGGVTSALEAGEQERLADAVYHQLREEIVLGRLRPRDPLVEIDLAARLQISRTPVRESLHRLAADGLIVSQRRRWVVYEHSRREVCEIYEVRMALESYAARVACERAEADQVEQLRSLVADHDADEGGEPFVQFNARFHQQVAETSNNAYLIDLIGRNRLYHFNTQIAATYTPDDVHTANEQHLALVQAIGDRASTRAETIARDHVHLALRLLLERIPLR